MSFQNRTSSRFNLANPILTRDGLETYGLINKPRFLQRENLLSTEIGQIIITPDLAGKIDRLAVTIYGNQDLLWIIPMFNRIENPLLWPLNGQIVEYPLPSVVFSEI